MRNARTTSETTASVAMHAPNGNRPSAKYSGLRLVFQHWIADTVGPNGLSASNGLSVTTP